MSITYPLSLVDFWEQLRFADRPVFVPQHNRKQSMSGGGEILSYMLGKPKWSISVTLANGRHNKNLLQEADMMHLGTRDGTILAYDIRRPYPQDDPVGWKLDGRTVTVATKGANNRSLSLSGLSKQFTCYKGDKYSVLYDTDKRFLFEVMETTQANDSGVTPEFEIWPVIPAGVLVGGVVTMRKACAKFKLVAGSFRPNGGAGDMSSGFAFSLISVP